MTKAEADVGLAVPAGTKVRFAYPDRGDEDHQEHAAEHLTAGQIYTVDAMVVGKGTDLVVLAEFRGKVFDAVHFALVDDTEGADDEEMDTTDR